MAWEKGSDGIVKMGDEGRIRFDMIFSPFWVQKIIKAVRISVFRSGYPSAFPRRGKSRLWATEPLGGGGGRAGGARSRFFAQTIICLAPGFAGRGMIGPVKNTIWRVP
jgi:hypothetical protein